MNSNIFILCLFLTIIGDLGCTKVNNDEPLQHSQARDVALAWNQQLLVLDCFSEGYRPPISARMFAYIGIAAWEAGLPAAPNANSFVRNYGTVELPVWDNTETFVLPAALNAAYRTMVSYFFPHAPLRLRQQSIELSTQFDREWQEKYPATGIMASEAFGKNIAMAICQWSATDKIGHQAYLYNYDRNYVPPVGVGRWVPSTATNMPALLPAWGTVRTFVVAPQDIAAKPPVAYSEQRGSAFFSQAMEVYTVSSPLSSEDRWIAEFWADDFPGVTFSASARWISITNQIIKKEHPPITECLEIWMKTGLALHDTGAKVWCEKYTFSLERPDTYIRRVISPNWSPLHNPPSFASYPSGHAAFGAAATTVLAEYFGPQYQITDRSHEGHKEFLSTPRSYNSLDEMAKENAFSRILIGVHFRMDAEEGLRLGNLVGTKINNIKLYKTNPAN